jgi:hypothetical protein
MTSPEPASFRPGFGHWLTGAFAVVAAVTALISLIDSGFDAIVTLWPWLALLVGGCWAIYWHPEVRVDDDGVTLVNVWHRVEVPWGGLIGIETKWALTLVTPKRRYRAWAAPAPGRSVMRREQRDTHRLKDAAIGGEIRPGDLPHTDSGAAANMVRGYWSAVHESGALDDVDAVGVAAIRSIHWRVIGVGALLVALAIIGVM